MKTDAYTKFVLTVIAVCLTIVAIDRLRLPEAHAQASQGTMNVRIVGVEARDYLRVHVLSRNEVGLADAEKILEQSLEIPDRIDWDDTLERMTLTIALGRVDSIDDCRKVEGTCRAMALDIIRLKAVTSSRLSVQQKEKLKDWLTKQH